MPFSTSPIRGRIKPGHWARLHDQRHLEYFQAIARKPEQAGWNWEPVLDLIRWLQTQGAAFRLFGFVSRYRLHLTTAPGYTDSTGHSCLVIEWKPAAGCFGLRFGPMEHGLVGDGAEERLVMPEAMEAVMTGLLQQLLDSREPA